MNNTPRTDSHASSDPTFAGGQAVSARFARTLERETNELRAIFPKILQSLESGACADDCSIEFLKHIPSEVASVTSKIRRENNELRQELDKLKKFVSKDFEAVKKIFGVRQ
jgi:hypothetical protein